MSNKQASKTNSVNQEDAILLTQFQRRVREGVFILTIALSVYIWLALFTYSANDPAWSHTVAAAKEVNNSAGVIGAYLSDVLLFGFGYTAFLLPLLFIYSGWLYFHQRFLVASEHRNFRLIIRSAGLVIFTAALSSLLNFISPHSPATYAFGGILGQGIAGLLVSILNLYGTILSLGALLLVGMTWFFGISWLKLADQIGALTLSGFKYLLKKPAEWRQKSEEGLSELPAAAPLSNSRIEPKLNRNAATSSPIVPPAKQPPKLPEKNPAVTILAPKAQLEPSVRAQKERQEDLFEAPLAGTLPPLSLLDEPEKKTELSYNEAQLTQMSQDVEQRLADFGIEAQVVAVLPGPVVTRFELNLAAGTKVSRISALAKDLARSLSVISVRIVEVIPGKSVIGLELPNEKREVVRLREILSSAVYEQARSPLTLALGKDIAGSPVIVDLGKMPHLLVAGTTGSGKSVGLNAMLLSLLYKATPDQLRLIMIDPKMLELAVYEGIPHLLTPVVTDMRDAANALRWCVGEMDKRYRLMASLGVRNLAGYNAKIKEAEKSGQFLRDPFDESPEPANLRELPYIVVLADEYADLMMVVGKKIEELIARIAQKARAAGIHLILATQRPSVDVVTGLIKANIPTRISFQVSSRIDSRTVLDQQGAEQLLGHGDMLYLPPGTGVPVRVHGAFVADAEVHRVVQDLKRRGPTNYREDVLAGDEGSSGSSEGQSGDAAAGGNAEADPLYDQAVQIVIESRRASISHVQRRLRIGYNRAANLIEAMEQAGIVSAMEQNGTREVLVPEANA